MAGSFVCVYFLVSDAKAERVNETTASQLLRRLCGDRRKD